MNETVLGFVLWVITGVFLAFFATSMGFMADKTNLYNYRAWAYENPEKISADDLILIDDGYRDYVKGRE